MFTIQERDLFGWWVNEGSEFDTLEDAKTYCVEMADALNIAYRIVDDNGAIVDVIDLAADFFGLGGMEPGDYQD